MSQGIDHWITEYLLRPPLVALRFILAPLYELIFGWLDRRFAASNEAKLRQEVRDAFGFLFDEYHGHIITNEGAEFPPMFDYAFVTVAADNLRIRFSRGRGELDVQISSDDSPNDWHEIMTLLSLLEGGGDLKRRAFIDL